MNQPLVLARPPAPPLAEASLSAVVIGRNEAARIGLCLRALARAAGGLPLHVTVLLNGTSDASAAVAAAALRETGLPGRIYDIPHGDKAHAINLFLHRLRPPAATYVFVDAYAEVQPDALLRLAGRLEAAPFAQAAAAVPSTGRSAAALGREMQIHPGLHGSLFALRGSFVARLAAAGARLPLGLYRGDSLLGSMVAHDLDAARGGWVDTRIAVEPLASWVTPPGQPWRWRDLRRHFRRLVQQGRGRLEWPPICAAIRGEGYGALPADANRMVLDWIAADPAARTPRPWRDPFAWLALRRARQSGPGPGPASGRLLPRLLLRNAGG
jgi:hypothetical protein